MNYQSSAFGNSWPELYVAKYNNGRIAHFQADTTSLTFITS